MASYLFFLIKFCKMNRVSSQPAQSTSIGNIMSILKKRLTCNACDSEHRFGPPVHLGDTACAFADQKKSDKISSRRGTKIIGVIGPLLVKDILRWLTCILSIAVEACDVSGEIRSSISARELILVLYCTNVNAT